MESDDVQVIKNKTEALSKVSQKLAEEMYKSQSAEAGAAPGAEASDESQSSDGRQAGDVEDADYEVVDEDK